MEEKRGYLCSECRYWLNPNDVLEETNYKRTRECEKGHEVDGLSYPCVQKSEFFLSYSKSALKEDKPIAQKVKRVQRAPVEPVKRARRLFSFNQKGNIIIPLMVLIGTFLGIVFLGTLVFNHQKSRENLNRFVIIPEKDLQTILNELKEHNKMLEQLNKAQAINYAKIELLERALLSSSLFEILRGEEGWTYKEQLENEEEQ